MNQIYGMESLIDVAQAQIVWGSHVSMIKWGSLTLAQLSMAASLQYSVSTNNWTTQYLYFW